MIETSKGNVLIVEDEPSLLKYTARKLSRGGYKVLMASSIAEARRKIESAPVDLAVLDIMLPDGSGLDFCAEIKAKKDVMVLFLTGKTQIQDRITGLDTGGDYYMVKPFDLDEMQSVVNSLFRRRSGSGSLQAGSIRLDMESMTATVKGVDLLLTPKEFTLLHVLVKHRDMPITAEELFHKCWPSNENEYSRSLLWAQLSRLRKKLESAGVFYITSIRNIGYCLEIKE